MSHISQYVRGVVFHEGVILFLENLNAYRPDIGVEPTTPGVLPLAISRSAEFNPLKAADFKRLRNQCMRDTLVYETDRGNNLGIYTERDYPLTPERLVGRIEGVSEPSSDPAEQPCPRDPDTSGSGT